MAEITDARLTIFRPDQSRLMVPVNVEPYVLVRVTQDPDAPDDVEGLRLDIEGGNGVDPDSPDEIVDLLRAVADMIAGPREEEPSDD